MIIVKLIGGLGNQLFQHALGRHLAHIHKTELKLDISGFGEYKLHAYGLGHFNIKENFATEKEVRGFKKYQRKPGRLWFPYNRLIADEHKYAQEKQFNFDPRILEIGGDAYLDGYWQTEKYFKPIENIIRGEFTLKFSLAPASLLVADKIRAFNSVALHIRRGDYVNNPNTLQHHGVCSAEYYRQAIKEMAKKIKDPHFFVFSDDPQWARKNIVSHLQTTFVDHNTAERNYEDIMLISLCKHQIIANSSFSWWGAWLNTNKNKIVLAPKRWFQTQKMDTRDIIPDSWTKI